MSEPLISVIIPAFNVEKYIIRCLDSIANQVYQNLEIIVVDDGSTDGTGSIIDEYASKDPRVKVIHQQNKGVSSARIAGINQASGEYIGFVDSDDYIDPLMYRRLLENALKYQADISHCGYKMIFPDGHEDLYYGTGELTVMNRDTGLLELLKGEKIEPAIWNKLYISSITKNVHLSPLWTERIRINEDLLMNYILFKNANCSVFEDHPFYHYILRKNSAATSKNIYNATDPLRVIDLIKNDIPVGSECEMVVYSRYLRLLIKTASENYSHTMGSSTRQRLRYEVKSLSSKSFSISPKLTAMLICSAYMMPLYKMIRFIYDTVKGNRKKYDLGN